MGTIFQIFTQTVENIRATKGNAMTDLYDNPMGLDGFEFVEFASPDPKILENAFLLLGFTEVATHRSKDVTLWR